MKREYILEGMSCGGCVKNVKNTLLQLPGVEDAEVHLHPQSAVLTMKETIAVAELQVQLNKAGRYRIMEVISI